MAHQTVTLNLPDDLYQRLKQHAEKTHRTIEAEVVDVLATGVPASGRLSPELEGMLNSMALLDDEALWRAGRNRLPREMWEEIETLHFKRQREGLMDAEQERLSWLMRQYEQAMLIRAEAAALLKQRGHDVNVLLQRP